MRTVDLGVGVERHKEPTKLIFEGIPWKRQECMELPATKC